MTIEELFSLEYTLAREYLKQFRYPWAALEGLKNWIQLFGAALEGYQQRQPGVWVHPSAEIADTAQLTGPCIVGPETELRHGAFLRGSVLIGSRCVVGNSTEVKNAILFDGVQVPHFNYVGDSILGYRAHLGAGVICSNVRGDKGLVSVGGIPTGRKKVGAMVGDEAEIGCNTVLNPGTVIGKRTRIYPVSSVRGMVPADSVFKNDGTIYEMK